jgi:hypothetical protein
MVFRWRVDFGLSARKAAQLVAVALDPRLRLLRGVDALRHQTNCAMPLPTCSEGWYH